MFDKIFDRRQSQNIYDNCAINTYTLEDDIPLFILETLPVTDQRLSLR